ncbi:hypothetical protein EVG20_g5484 [Dentipellis fragilis]|uniref:Uncharacterized protein n=1 Tax=Dentipellis fragilis TaxID=205917 RepID=A0A4Y9YV37_9AGAM|nr:hypothetical protein EVG20_g5484 [Dentipellis fragilis]
METPRALSRLELVSSPPACMPGDEKALRRVHRPQSRHFCTQEPTEGGLVSVMTESWTFGAGSLVALATSPPTARTPFPATPLAITFCYRRTLMPLAASQPPQSPNMFACTTRYRIRAAPSQHRSRPPPFRCSPIRTRTPCDVVRSTGLQRRPLAVWPCPIFDTCLAYNVSSKVSNQYREHGNEYAPARYELAIVKCEVTSIDLPLYVLERDRHGPVPCAVRQPSMRASCVATLFIDCSLLTPMSLWHEPTYEPGKYPTVAVPPYMLAMGWDRLPPWFIGNTQCHVCESLVDTGLPSVKVWSGYKYQMTSLEIDSWESQIRFMLWTLRSDVSNGASGVSLNRDGARLTRVSKTRRPAKLSSPLRPHSFLLPTTATIGSRTNDDHGTCHDGPLEWQNTNTSVFMSTFKQIPDLLTGDMDSDAAIVTMAFATPLHSRITDRAVPVRMQSPVYRRPHNQHARTRPTLASPDPSLRK